MAKSSEFPKKTVRTLLVEDNPGDTRLAIEALNETSLRNNLTVVRDGQAALDFLFKRGDYSDVSSPDLILLDLNLPQKNGFEVLSMIKEDKRLKRIPVIILTVSNAGKDVLRSYECHANCYIVKPISLDKFIVVIKAIEEFWLNIAELPPGG